MNVDWSKIQFDTRRPTLYRVVYVEGVIGKDLNAIFGEMIDIAKDEHVVVRANDLNTKSAYAYEWDTVEDVRKRWEENSK